MKKAVIPLILIFLCCITAVTANTSNIQVEPSPNSVQAEAYFLKICDVPYQLTNNTTDSFSPGVVKPEQFWKNGYGDCDDRAECFKEYLVSHGARNVTICHVYRVNEETGNRQLLLNHYFIVWHDKVYSPSHPKDERYYNTDKTVYQKFLKEKYGFNRWCEENQTEGTPF